MKDLHSALRMALHDLLTFTKCAVKTAISNRGQIAVVVKVMGCSYITVKYFNGLEFRA